ncbi:hypothetical protein KIN20_011472 [Parelaphostrongylus tenuis]|uniref:Uncharacterized protein n=1 Tax=Parelaphostrongylus tenuis TaxID=148309 RepID=A0AAD5MS42_PARTN|nr:hypothetical protein KIN20_011472 [Parelaphostrongylus tenuis]
MKTDCFGKTKFGMTVMSRIMMTDFDTVLDGDIVVVRDRKPTTIENNGNDS